MVGQFNAECEIEQLRLGIRLMSAPERQPTVASEARGTARTRFLPHQVPNLVLFPSDLSSLLPRDHFVYTVIKAVRCLELSGILAKYEGKGSVGRPAYDPTMMLMLIIYCHSQGCTSSRGIEKMARENIPCRIISGGQTPDHDTIANFLVLHRQEFDNIFQQVLQMADKAGLVRLDHVSVDGSKIKANASKRKAMSHGRMRKQVRKLRKEIADLGKQLKRVAKQTTPTAIKEAQRLRQEIDFRTPRLAKIEKFKKELEERVAAKAQAKAAEKESLKRQGQNVRNPADRKKTKPKATDQINFTDPESRIMLRSGRQFEQCYNAQIVVDSHAQIIVAHDTVQDANDKKMLQPMLQQVVQRLGRSPNRASGDSGYFSEENLTSAVATSIELLIPPDRETFSRTTAAAVGRIPADLSIADRMRRKLSTRRGKEEYALRKCIVEPVFGQIKSSVFGISQFSTRGLASVRCEWALICAAHNLVKIWRSGQRFGRVESDSSSLVA